MTQTQTVHRFIRETVQPLLASYSFQRALVAENSRFRAFLFGIPFDYIGWTEKGTQIKSPTFNRILADDDTPTTINQLCAMMVYPDNLDLERAYKRLIEGGEEFSLHITHKDDGRHFHVIGTQSPPTKKTERFAIVWFRDETDEVRERQDVMDRLLHAKQAAELYQTTFESFPFPIWIRGQDNRISWCNRAYARIFDSTPARIIDEQTELMPPSQSLGLSEKVSKLGRSHTVNHHMIIGGERRFVEITEIPIQSAAQNLGFLRDITDIETYQKELKNFTDANSEVLGQLTIPVAIFDRDMSLDFYNRAYQLLWEFPEKWLDTKPRLIEILNKMRENRLLPEQVDFRKYVEHWRHLFTSLIDPHEEMMFLPNGKALRMVMVPHPKGGVMVTYEDVTSRLELESSYNTLIAVQRETIDNLAEAVSVFGADGRLKLYNQSYQRIWGLSQVNLNSQPHISDLAEMVAGYFDEKKWPFIKEKLVASCLEQQEKSGKLMRVDGTILDYALVPLPDGALLCSYVDITDTVRVEQALREKNIALEEADKLKSGFLANVSYQLRTPLNALLGFADMLDQEYFGTLNDKQKEYTANMLEAGNKLVSLIDDILDLSTIQAGFLELNIQKLNLSDLFARIKKDAETQAADVGIVFEMAYPKTIGTLEGDERRLLQIFGNIIQNALSYTKPGGTVRFEAVEREKRIEVLITDTGVGMSDEQMEKIFQPFVRMQRSANQRGAGIGLALVKSITELHQGAIAIQSTKDVGTTVTVVLPRKQNQQS